jgi:outer membrane protein TolC
MFWVGCAMAASLDEALTAAETHSRELALARASTRAAESLRGQAWSTLAPKLQANGSYTINDQEIAFDLAEGLPPELAGFIGDVEPIVIQEKEYFSWNFSVVQPLFNGRSLPLLRGAYGLAQAARDDERGAEQQLREGVTRAYYGVLTSREAEAIAAQAVESNRAALDVAQRTVEAGLAPPRASLQAELAASGAERDARNATAARVAAEQALARLTGLPADTPVELPPTPAVAADAVLMVENRPDIAAADQRAAVARRQREANWIGWSPEVDGRFTYSWSENTGFSGKNDLWMVVFEARWLLWDGGYRLAKARETASQVQSAQLYALRQREIASEEVAVAKEQLSRARSAVDAVSKEIVLAEKNLAQAQDAFAAGSLTFLELQSAELQLRSSRLSALVERMNLDLAAVALERSLGTY